jgi:hypothetical protein
MKAGQQQRGIPVRKDGCTIWKTKSWKGGSWRGLFVGEVPLGGWCSTEGRAPKREWAQWCSQPQEENT